MLITILRFFEKSMSSKILEFIKLAIDFVDFG